MRFPKWLIIFVSSLSLSLCIFVLWKNETNALSTQSSFAVQNNGCGTVYYASSTWPKTHDSSKGSSVYLGSANFNSYSNSSTSFVIQRAFNSFDLTPFPSDTKFDNVQLCFYRNASLGNPFPLYLVEANQASTSTLTTNDYNKTFSKVLATFATGTPQTWNCATLTNTSTLIGGTWMKVALITRQDYLNQQPIGSNYVQNPCWDNTNQYRTQFLNFDVNIPNQQTINNYMTETDTLYIVFGVILFVILFVSGYMLIRRKL